MSSIDTPLMSLEAMQKAQQANKAPYLVLTSKSATSQGSLDIRYVFAFSQLSTNSPPTVLQTVANHRSEN